MRNVIRACSMVALLNTMVAIPANAQTSSSGVFLAGGLTTSTGSMGIIDGASGRPSNAGFIGAAWHIGLSHLDFVLGVEQSLGREVVITKCETSSCDATRVETSVTSGSIGVALYPIGHALGVQLGVGAQHNWNNIAVDCVSSCAALTGFGNYRGGIGPHLGISAQIPRTPVVLQGDVTVLKFKPASNASAQKTKRYGELHLEAMIRV